MPSGGGQRVLVDWGATGTGQRSTFNLLWSNAIRFEVAGNGISGSIAVNDGLWHHVAVVVDPSATNTVSLYVDGVLDAAGTPTVSINTATTNNIRIGQRIDGVNNFEGDMDEVRVWNVARTQAELQANMDDELCNLPSSLILYCTMNDGIAGGTNTALTSVTDYSPSGGTCTLSNFGLTGATSNIVTGYTYGPGFTIGSTTSVGNCGAYTWPVNGQTYASSGLYTSVVSATTGCDSVVQLDLTVNGNTTANHTAVACSSYVWSVDGQTYTTTGIYSGVIPNAAGCDSLINLALTITGSTNTTETVTACASYTWPLNGQTYTASTTAHDTLMSVQGCDSIITLNLTIPQINNTLTTLTPTSFIANQSTAQYQWIDCSNNSIIPNETSQTFSTSIDGSYAVIITLNNCSDTSDCVTVNTVGLDALETATFSLSPNPTTGVFEIQSSLNMNGSIRIIDAQGKLVYNEFVNQSVAYKMNLGHLNEGVYFVQIPSETGTQTLRLIKKD